MSRFRLAIDSSLTSLFMISVFVRGICGRLGMSMADTSAVEVCAFEAVTNAIKHAYLGAQGNEVSVEAAASPERLDLYVRDKGRSMSADHVRRLSKGSLVLEFDPIAIGSIPEGGMGLQIIHKLMDEAIYSVEDGTNCLRLTKFIQTSDSRKAEHSK